MLYETIFQMWRGTADFARDVGVTTDLASKWRRERGIPSERWETVLAVAKAKGLPLRAEDLLAAQTAARGGRAA